MFHMCVCVYVPTCVLVSMSVSLSLSVRMLVLYRYRRATTGLWPFQREHTEVVDGYTATVYDLEGITLEAKVGVTVSPGRGQADGVCAHAQTRTEHVAARKALGRTPSVAGPGTAAVGTSRLPPTAVADADGDVFEDALSEAAEDTVPHPGRDGDGDGDGGDDDDEAHVSVGDNDDDNSARAAFDAGAARRLPNVAAVERMMEELAAHKDDLPPPPPPTLSADAYFDPASGGDTSSHPPGLGRPVQLATRRHSFKTKVIARGVFRHGHNRAQAVCPIKTSTSPPFPRG
jgi:hypothetical protein